MIAFRSFVCVDMEPPAGGPYLVLASAPGVSVTFYGPTLADARGKADAWAAEQRGKGGRRPSPKPRKSPEPKAQA